MPWNFICSLVFAMISSFYQQKRKKKKITFSIQQKKKEDINKRMVSTLWDIYCLLHNIIPQNYSQWNLDTSLVCKCPQLHIRSPDTPLHVLHQATNEQKQVLQNDTGQACIDSKGTRKMVLETYILSRSMLKVYVFPCNFRNMSKDKLTTRKVSNSCKGTLNCLLTHVFVQTS